MMASATNLRARPLSHPLAIRFSTLVFPRFRAFWGLSAKTGRAMCRSRSLDRLSSRQWYGFDYSLNKGS